MPETIQHPAASLTANLGDGRSSSRVTFLGYDLAETKVEPGETLHLTLYWQARREMETSYKVFTHLLDQAASLTGEEQIWGQRDSIPVGGTHPTTGWLAGEVIVDRYEIRVKPGIPAGEYRIEIGMYDVATGERLPAWMEGERVQGDRILLEKIKMERG